MMKKKHTPKGGRNSFLCNVILPSIKSPFKVQVQGRQVKMYSQLRIRLLDIIKQLKLPCCVKLEELSDLLDEPIGKTQSGLYALKRAELVDYIYLFDAGYVITSVVETDTQVTGCPYGLSSCDMCVIKSSACQDNMVIKRVDHDDRY